MTTHSSMSTFRTSGDVIDGASHDGLAGLRVESWDSAHLCPDLVGCVFTDADGAFRMSLDTLYLHTLFLDGSPTLFFRVFRGRDLIASTEGTVVWQVYSSDTEIRILVNLSSPPERGLPTAFSVRGQVLDAVTGPLAGQTVRAFDKNLRSEELLGEAVTDRAGRYDIDYLSDSLVRFGKGQISLTMSIDRSTLRTID